MKDDGDAVDADDDDEGGGHPRGDADRLRDLRRARLDHPLADQVRRAEYHGVDPPGWAPW
jgi:hypothetical protein